MMCSIIMMHSFSGKYIYTQPIAVNETIFFILVKITPFWKKIIQYYSIAVLKKNN